MSKRFVRLILTALLLCCSLLGVAQEAARPSGATPAYVECHGLTYIPAYSTTDRSFVRNLVCGERLTVLGEEGAWARVQLQDGSDVWCARDSVKSTELARVDCRGLSNVSAYSSPSPDKRLVKNLGCGERVTALSEEKGWMKVRLQDGNEVWVSHWFIKNGFHPVPQRANERAQSGLATSGRPLQQPTESHAQAKAKSQPLVQDDEYPLRVKVIQTENAQMPSPDSPKKSPPYSSKAEGDQAFYYNLGALLRDLASVRGRTASLVEVSDGRAYVIACDSTALHTCTWLTPREDAYPARWSRGGLTIGWWAWNKKTKKYDQWKTETYYVVSSRLLEK